MPRYLVRVNCEFSTVIEAPSADAALLLAEEQDIDSWEKSWSCFDVEEE